MLVYAGMPLGWPNAPIGIPTYPSISQAQAMRPSIATGASNGRTHHQYCAALQIQEHAGRSGPFQSVQQMTLKERMTCLLLSWHAVAILTGIVPLHWHGRRSTSWYSIVHHYCYTIGIKTVAGCSHSQPLVQASRKGRIYLPCCVAGRAPG